MKMKQTKAFLRSSYRSLQLKITVLIFLLLVGTSLSWSIYFSYNTKTRAINIAKGYIKSLPVVVESSVKTFMNKGDRAGMRGLVKELENDRNILGIHIFNSYSQLTKSFKKLKGRYTENYMNAITENLRYKEQFRELHVDGKEFIAYYKPIKNKEDCQGCHFAPKDSVLGAMNINIDTSHLQKELSEDIQVTTYLMLLTNVVLFFILFLLIRLLVTKPVKNLEHGMVEVARNNLDIRLKINSKDEFERMSILFNRMVESLHDAFETISDMHKNSIHTDRLSTMGTLAASISHEIKNPLNSIMVTSEIMAAKCDEALPFADKIMADTERIRDIIDQTLQFSRLDNEGTECISIKDFVQDIELYVNRTMFRMEGIRFLTEVDDNLNFININRVSFQQILINLLKNAMDTVMEKHSSARNGRVSLIVRPYEDEVEFIVRDNGGGIPEKIRPRIFNDFFTTKSTGTGLGLAIVKNLVEKHYGEIFFNSEEGEGTEFVIRMPMSKTCADEL